MSMVVILYILLTKPESNSVVTLIFAPFCFTVSVLVQYLVNKLKRMFLVYSIICALPVYMVISAIIFLFSFSVIVH